MLLVFDNFHAVTDPGLHLLLNRGEHTATTSSVVVTSRIRIAQLHALPLVAQVEIRVSAADTKHLLARRGVSHLPDSADDLNEWIALVFAELSADAM
jgi:hypothetical protein